MRELKLQELHARFFGGLSKPSGVAMDFLSGLFLQRYGIGFILRRLLVQQ